MGRKLGRIQIAGGSDRQRMIFRTALLSLIADANNLSRRQWRVPRIRSTDSSVDGFNYYTDMSLWDTFRTVHPLLQIDRAS